MFSSRSTKGLGLAVTLGLCLFSTNVAHSQVFVTSDTTINYDVGYNGVFVGKDNATNFTTLPGTVTLTVEDGAVLYGGNLIKGNYYQGLHVFGNNRADINGGLLAYADGYNTSTVNISGGNVTGLATGYNSSTVNITGGTIHVLVASNSSTFNVSGGSGMDLFGVNTSIFNLIGGNIATHTIRLFDNSVLNIFGSGLAAALTGTGSDLDGSYTDYTLSGTLQGGQSIDGVSLYEYSGNLGLGDPTQGGSNTGNVRFFVTSVSTPEPPSLTLLALTAFPVVGLIRRRKA